MTSSQPLVSVILPFYNAPFLSEAVESILSQSYTNFELLLIDNGSTDCSSEVAKSYKSDSRVRLLNETKRGVVFAANKGIQNANGHFIARMDADDISHHDRLMLQVELLSKHPNIDVASGLVSYLGDSQNEGFIHYVDWLNGIRTEKEIRQNQFVEFPMANPTLMFRREVFEEHGLYEDGDFPEDYELFLRLQANNVKMKKVENVILQWRDSKSRLTRTDDRYTQDAFFRIKAKYLALWLKENNSHHPNIYIWGAGRLSRKRSAYLLDQGMEVVKYIDLSASDNIISYLDVPEKSHAFILSYVGNRGAREEIRTFLNQKGYTEGINYVIAS